MKRLAQGALAYAALAISAPVWSQVPSNQDPDCLKIVADLIQRSAPGETRYTVVFKGTQQQLSPLFGALYSTPILENLIPLNKSTFLLVIEGTASNAEPNQSKVAATRICQAALSAGAHFHGAVRQAGNRLIDGSFSMVP